MHQRISLCMIAKNEEANLPTCLTSVKDLVHDMTIVDTGSTDRTKDVASQLGARVIDFAWVDSFAAARNESIRWATGDWILWLDGDEHFDADNRDKLRILFTKLKPELAAYVIKQRSAPEHAGNSATLVDQVRLFRNRPEIRWRYRVHEQILPALREAGHAIRFTEICLEHTGYQDAALLVRKTERNLRLLHLQEAEDPDDPFILFNLGWVYQDTGQAAKAIPYLRRSLALSQPGDSIVRKLYTLLAQAFRTSGQAREALAACRAGRAHCPDDPELLFQEAQLLREQGQPASAEACLRQLLTLRPSNHFASLDAGVQGVKARNLLAWVSWEQGRAAEAEAAWRTVLAEQPRFLPAWQGLADVFLAQARWPELEQATSHLHVDGRLLADATVLRARAHLARKEFDAAQTLLEEAIRQDPRAVGPRVFLSHVLLQRQDLPAAEPVLRAILDLDPRQAEAWRNLAVLLQAQRRLAEVVAICQAGQGHCPDEPQLAQLQQMAQRQLDETAGNKPTADIDIRPLDSNRLRLAFAAFSPFPFTIDTPYSQPLGGSESALCYLAEALAQQGHEVFLLTATRAPVHLRGVHCWPRSAASIRQFGPFDAFIVQNFAGKGREIRTLLPRSTPLVFWSQHAQDQPGVQALHDAGERRAYDAFVFVSDWQRRQYGQHFRLDPKRMVVLQNAISPAFAALFADNLAILDQKRNPPVLAYTSTPYRGLDRLLEAFPRIRRAVPGMILKVFSSMRVYHVPESEEQARFGSLYQQCRETEGVEYVGSLPQPELARQLRAASVLAYPNTFAETSCIAVLEAMASGCCVVTSELAALPETSVGFARLIPVDTDRNAYLKRFGDVVIEVLQQLAQPNRTEAEEEL
ncbi:MAG TPA: glycosyltransferase, partial [Gemmataceae bacterium]|nr:glycosyltransferase [Gemmataceae bacterium]